MDSEDDSIIDLSEEARNHYEEWFLSLEHRDLKKEYRSLRKELEDAFGEECQKRNIRLFVLPPNSPELNGYVERAHLTHTKAFCEVTDSSFNVVGLKDELLDRRKVSQYDRDI